MTSDTWQRVKNLALFKVWMTDRQLRKFWPVAAGIALVALVLFAARYLFAVR
jgi:hypothetical protein